MDLEIGDILYCNNEFFLQEKPYDWLCEVGDGYIVTEIDDNLSQRMICRIKKINTEEIPSTGYMFFVYNIGYDANSEANKFYQYKQYLWDHFITKEERINRIRKIAKSFIKY